MIVVPQPYEELHELVGALCEGTIEADDFARLQTILAGDLEAQRFYVRCLDIHAALRRLNVEGEAVGQSSGEEAGVSASVAGPVRLVASRPFAPLHSHSVALGALLTSTLLVLLLVAMVVGVPWTPTANDRPRGAESAAAPMVIAAPAARTTAKGRSVAAVVGQVTRIASCTWADPAKAAAVGEAVRLGRLFDLASGQLEIRYDCGATVTLAGPAVFEVDSRDGGFLSFGRLTAHVERGMPSPAFPFVIRTPLRDAPNATVGDMGAEFVVAVDRAGLSVVRSVRGLVRQFSPVNGGRLHMAPLPENPAVVVGRDANGLPRMSLGPSEPPPAVSRNTQKGAPMYSEESKRKESGHEKENGQGRGPNS